MNGPHIDRETDGKAGRLVSFAVTVLDLFIVVFIEVVALAVASSASFVIADPNILGEENWRFFYLVFFLLMIPGSIPAYLYGRSGAAATRTGS